MTEHERERFLKAARAASAPVGVFCEVLAYTGCGVSQALALTPESVDPAEGVLVFESFE